MSTRPNRILVVIGTPIAGSLNHSLADAYRAAAVAAGAEVRVVDLASDPIPGHPRERAELRAPRGDGDVPIDPEIAPYVEALVASDHIALFYPQWWGTFPAALTAFVDRVFLSGIAFRYHREGQGWDRLLQGRTARITMTMDSPAWWHRFVYRTAADVSLRQAVLAYCGVRTVRTTRHDRVRFRPGSAGAWIAAAGRAGRADATRPRRT